MRDLCAFAAFDGAVFDRPLLVTEPGRDANRHFASAVAAAARAAGDDATAVAAADYDADKDELADERGAAARFAALEGGLRTLKLAMREQGDHLREQRFYRYELRARRHNPATPVWEKVASLVYGWSSDYGNSIARPFAWLLALIGVFAIVYGLWGAAVEVAGADLDSVRRALEFSLHNVFRPFDV